MSRSKLTSRYIDSIVPTPEDGLVANKTYTLSGSLNEIQIWNITTRPAEPTKNMSWKSHYERIMLMGTVAFLPEKEKIEQLQLEDGWQSLMPTRFSCGENATVSIEVACTGCRLEFDQLFSNRPLGECSGITNLRCVCPKLIYIGPDVAFGLMETYLRVAKHFKKIVH